jgi:hypothetical protein
MKREESRGWERGSVEKRRGGRLGNCDSVFSVL